MYNIFSERCHVMVWNVNYEGKWEGTGKIITVCKMKIYNI